jgi:hypothetical protein
MKRPTAEAMRGGAPAVVRLPITAGHLGDYAAGRPAGGAGAIEGEA